MHRLLTTALCLIALTTLPAGPASAQNRELLGEYRIGLIGRSLGDAYFQAIRSGAQDAARQLGKTYAIDVELLVHTPLEADADAQLGAVSRAFVEDVDGLAIDPVQGESMRPLLETMRDQGLQIAFFGSEIDGFEPLVSFPAHETRAGRLAGLAVGSQMAEDGRAAILIPRNADSRMTARLKGVRAALGFRRVYGLVECEPDYASALAAISDAMENDAEDQIEGWVFLGEWPLNGTPALPWEADAIACAAIGASPSALMHLERDHIEALVVHPYYEWGYRTVTRLIEELHAPSGPRAHPEDASLAPGGPQLIDWNNREDYGQAWQDWMR